jgi:Domain of unknown function (DUF4390)
MKTDAARKIAAWVLCLVIFVSQTAFAQDARLTNVIVTNTRDDLLLYLSVDGAFTEKIKEAVLSGVPVSFSFFADLQEVRTLWFDAGIADVDVTHTIKYDNLKKEFTITRSWESGPPPVVQSFEEAQRLMTEIDSLKVVPLGRLEKGTRYQIRAKAELSKLTLPFYLHYVLFFVSLWDFETEWYTIDFIY